MTIKDFKGKNTYRTLGLRRGKAAIKRETSPLAPKRVCLWLGLFALVALLNYLVFVRLGPIGKKGPKLHGISEGYKRADAFAECLDAGCTRYQEGDLKGAIEAYSEAIALKPEEIRSYLNRGVAYIELRLYDKAIDDCNTVIAMDPDHSEAYHNRGRACLQKGLLETAILDCSKALTLDPHMAIAYRTRGMAYKEKGMLERAKSDLQKSCELGDAHSCKAHQDLKQTMNHEN
jgi:tetratricopeptide (TPR) repeat protein